MVIISKKKMVAMLFVVGFPAVVLSRPDEIHMSHLRYSATEDSPPGLTDSTASQHTLSELSLCDSHDADCKSYCNDAPVMLCGNQGFFECWGTFKHTCTKGDRVSHYACDGAFAFVPGSEADKIADEAMFKQLPRMPLAHDADRTIMTSCEGDAAVLALSHKENAADEAADVLDADKRSHHSHDPEELVAGVTACRGRSIGVQAFADGDSYGELYFGCDSTLVHGYGRKVKARDDVRLSEEVQSGKEYVQAMFSREKGWMQKVVEAVGGTGGAGDEAGVPGQMDSPWEQLHTHEASLDTAGAPLHEPSTARQCTCNGKKLAWGGWWPCRGIISCEFSRASGGNKHSLDLQCRGITVLPLLLNRGLIVQHDHFSSEKLSSERLLVLSGRTKGFTKVRRHGWKGSLFVSKGDTSIHMRRKGADRIED